MERAHGAAIPRDQREELARPSAPYSPAGSTAEASQRVVGWDRQLCSRGMDELRSGCSGVRKGHQES